MLTSIATVSMSGTLENKLQAVADAGFDGVEIFENDLIVFPGSAADAGSIIRDLGLRCTLFQPFRDFEGLSGDLRRQAFDRAERKFDVMAELGTDLLLVCSSVSPAGSDDRERIVDDFRELGERAARRGVRVGYEALAWGRYINDHRQVWDVVRAADHPAVGIILDSFHSLVRKIPIDSLEEIDPDKIFIVQLADAPWLQMDYLSWSRHFRNLPGQGDIPVRAFVSALLKIGYSGPLSLEIFNDRFRALPARTVALDGMRALRLSMDEGARALGGPSPSPITPRVACDGVEFVEFALTAEEAELFRPVLRTLGFSHTGHHRTKAVERWQQGSINLVINAEPEGFAHSHNVVHGPAVAALGVRVDDVAGAMSRARALSIHSFEGRVGRGEMKIPAVRDPSGALLYLVHAGEEQEIWEQDFLPADDHSPGAGLLHIDHVAYAMSEQDILSWLLYYFALFDVEKGDLFEVPDPVGLVQVQPVATKDRRFRLLLSGSASPATLASRLMRRYWGAGVQYLSLATADIFETARGLGQLGLDRLPIPRNYYDDLQVRFGLSPELVERMAEFDILYDRDGSGEYFQLTSRAFRKRFFFEITERRSYDGYGSPNELVRLAAQSRYKEDEQFAL